MSSLASALVVDRERASEEGSIRLIARLTPPARHTALSVCCMESREAATKRRRIAMGPAL
jgi:hypothetical protein